MTPTCPVRLEKDVFMRFGAAFWAQRTDWAHLRDAVRRAEGAGFDSLWIDDHLLCDEGSWAAPKLEGASTLAAVAAITDRAQVGLLVGAIGFRNIGVTAKIATTIDAISGGRAVLGLGAGWFEREHEAFGIDFGASTGERLDRLAEAVPLLRRLLDGERLSHDGRFFRLRDALVMPRPVRPQLPILIGGTGPRRTLPLVARHADMWNAHGPPSAFAVADARLRELCERFGRDERHIERSVYLNVVIRDDAGTAAAAWTRYARRHRPIEGEEGPDAVGTVADVARRCREYAAAGVEHLIWVFRSPFDAATMDRLAEVREQLGAGAGESSHGP